MTLFQLMGHARCILACSQQSYDRLHLDGYLPVSLWLEQVY